MDKHATNDMNRVQTFWHGFSDTGSGIQTYEYCVSSGLTEGKCDIKPMSPIGIATRIQYYPEGPLHPGTCTIVLLDIYGVSVNKLLLLNYIAIN